VLALLMAVAAAGLFARTLRTGRWRDHLALGALMGLGAISKFNFALWPLGLVAAAALLPEWRGRLRPLRLLGALGIAGAVVGPVGLWVVRNPELASESVRKLAVAEGGWEARLLGTGDLGMALVSSLALALVVLGVFALAGRGERTWRPNAQLLAASSACSILVLWLGLLISGATEVAERWLLPVVWGAVPGVALWLWSGSPAWARRAFAGTVAGLWLCVMPLLPYASLVDPGYRGADFGPLVERLRARTVGGRPLEVESQWVAGNLAYHAPDLSPRLRRPGEAWNPGAVLVLEDGSVDVSDPGLMDRTGHDRVTILRGNREIHLVVVQADR
jgi:4-amino-4-deoxy-L-arabinose transferase-like glycosyltransferase